MRAMTSVTFVCCALFVAQVSDASRMKIDMNARKNVKTHEPDHGDTKLDGLEQQSNECLGKIQSLGDVIGVEISLFASSCGLETSDIESQENTFSVTLDGKSRLCSPTCQEVVGLGDDLPDIDATKEDCTDRVSQESLEGLAVGYQMLKAARASWKSCETTALSKDVDCDCDFKWNSFQHAYAHMVGTGHTTPAQRAAMYHRYKRECGCVKVTPNRAGIDPQNIAEGAGATDVAVSEELAQMRQFLVLEHIHKVVLSPSCAGAKQLFARFDINNKDKIDSENVIQTFGKYKTYQAKELKKLKGDKLKAVKELTDTIMSAIDRFSRGPKVPMSEKDIITFVMGDGVEC